MNVSENFTAVLSGKYILMTILVNKAISYLDRDPSLAGVELNLGNPIPDSRRRIGLQIFYEGKHSEVVKKEILRVFQAFGITTESTDADDTFILFWDTVGTYSPNLELETKAFKTFVEHALSAYEQRNGYSPEESETLLERFHTFRRHAKCRPYDGNNVNNLTLLKLLPPEKK